MLRPCRLWRRSAAHPVRSDGIPTPASETRWIGSGEHQQAAGGAQPGSRRSRGPATPAPGPRVACRGPAPARGWGGPVERVGPRLGARVVSGERLPRRTWGARRRAWRRLTAIGALITSEARINRKLKHLRRSPHLDRSPSEGPLEPDSGETEPARMPFDPVPGVGSAAPRSVTPGEGEKSLETRSSWFLTATPCADPGRFGGRQPGRRILPVRESRRGPLASWRVLGWRASGWVPRSVRSASHANQSGGAALEGSMAHIATSRALRKSCPGGEVGRGTGFAAEQERVFPPRKHPRPPSEELGT